MLQFRLYIVDYAIQKGSSSNTQHMEYYQLIFYTILIIFYVLTDLSVKVTCKRSPHRFQRVESLELKRRPVEAHLDSNRPRAG